MRAATEEAVLKASANGAAPANMMDFEELSDIIRWVLGD
jgi:hypothetical protein